MSDADHYLLPFQQQLIHQVEMGLAEIEAGGNSVGILLIGPSGSGKTHALDQIAVRHPPSYVGFQPLSPCCRIAVTSQADASATAASVLRQLGKPLPGGLSRVSLKHLEPDMWAALKARHVSMLFFEEFHNALLAGSPQLRGQLARFLKNIWNQHPVSSSHRWASPDAERGDFRLLILISGTDELLAVFERDEELASRFSCVIRAEKVGFSTNESFRDFRYVFRSLSERFGVAHLFNPNDNDIAARCLFACDSHLRRLEKLLQRAATLSKRRGEMPALELLADSFDEVGGLSNFTNPFRWPMDELAAQIRRAQKK